MSATTTGPATADELAAPHAATTALELLLELTGGGWAILAGATRVHAATGLEPEEAERLLADPALSERAAPYRLAPDLTLHVDLAADPLGPRARERLARHLAHLPGEVSRHHRNADALQALLDVGLQLQTREFDLVAVFAAIVDHARRLLHTDAAWLALVDDDEQVLKIVVASGIETEGFATIETPVGVGIGGLAVKEQRTIVVGDFRDDALVPGPRVRDAVTEEGLISLVCAPMLRDGRMLGALYVGNRTTTAFPEADVSLVSALAGQASVAIANAQLYRTVVENNELLEQSSAVHRQLTELALAAAGIPELAAAIATLAGRGIVVRRRGDDEPLRQPAVEGPPGAGDEPPVALTLPIRAGRDDLGDVDILGDEPVTELQRRTIEHGATVIALELVRQQAAQDVERRLQAELLDELLAAAPPYDARLLALARRFDVALDEPHRVLVVGARDPRSQAVLAAPQTLRRLREAVVRVAGSDAPAIVTVRGERAVLVVRREALAAWQDVVVALRRALDAAGCEVVLGVSAATEAVALAWGQASACMRLAEAGARGPAVGYDDLGPLRFVLDSADPAHVPDVIRSTLGPLIDYDAATRVPLLPTLKAYVDADGHQATAAAACYVHVSTLKYRLRRIEGILGVRLADADVRFELRLALRLAETLAALGTVVAPSLGTAGA